MNIYQHLSPVERAIIMMERQRGASLRQIAFQLNRSPSTVSREIRRNQDSSITYCATTAEKAYMRRRKSSVKPLKISSNPELCAKIESYLIERKWSPEQISALLKKHYSGQPNMQVSHETIYAHIYAYPRGELRKLLVQSLRRAKSKRGPRGTKESCYSSLKIAPEQLITNRPQDINTCEIAGHWEGDLIVGAMNKSCVGTLVERKTGYLILSKMQSKSAQHVREGFESRMETLPDFLRLSITYDRGAEMSQHPLLSKHLSLKVYFADRCAPWQRGSSENINGLLRQFLPKGEDLAVYTQSDLDHISWLLNTRPRKRFEFRTPQEMMEDELQGGLVSVALDS
jgi:transposase, IS30 family